MSLFQVSSFYPIMFAFTLLSSYIPFHPTNSQLYSGSYSERSISRLFFSIRSVKSLCFVFRYSRALLLFPSSLSPVALNEELSLFLHSQEGSQKFWAPFSLWKLMGTVPWNALHVGKLTVPNWWLWPSAHWQGGYPSHVLTWCLASMDAGQLAGWTPMLYLAWSAVLVCVTFRRVAPPWI